MSPAATPDNDGYGNALPPGTRLGEFELRRVIGVGGFGIVYLAFDHGLEREVAIKEYMPSSLASRTAGMHVSLTSPTHAETFALGLRSFVNEARLLARFDHPSLIKVHRFWEDRGTAYMVMPLLRGRTLREVSQAMASAPDERWLRELLEPLLGALEVLHREEVFHRDIAPDNILIGDDGVPMLLDFGAARHVISGRSQTLTAILKPSYAPIEQYGESGSLRQGAWTDLYALGATLHFLITRSPPAPATARMVHDEVSLVGLPGLAIGRPFLQVVDWMLAPRPADRPQSVAELREALAGTRPVPTRVAPPPPATWERTAALPPKTRPVPPPESGIDLDMTVVQPRQSPLSAPATQQRSMAEVPARTAASASGSVATAGAAAIGAARTARPLLQSASPVPATAGASGAKWVGAIVATLVLAAAALWALKRPSPPPPTVATPASAAAPSVPSPPLANAPQAAPPASTTAAAPAPTREAAPAATTPVDATAPAPVTPVVAATPAPAVPATVQPTPARAAAPTPNPGQRAEAARPLPAESTRAVTSTAPGPMEPGRVSAQAAPRPTIAAASRALSPERRPVPAPAVEPSAGAVKPPPVVAESVPSAPRTAVAREPVSPPSRVAAARLPEPAAPAPEPAMRNPREQCGGRVFLALHSCLLRECPKPQYRDHPECVRVRSIEERAGRTMP